MGGSHRKHGECEKHSGEPLERVYSSSPANVHVCEPCMNSTHLDSTHKGHNFVKIKKKKDRPVKDTRANLKNIHSDGIQETPEDNNLPEILKSQTVPDTPGAFPGKVSVSGPGIQNGTLGKFQGDIIVETRGAGKGKLSINVKGVKGGFRVDMFREHEFDRTINCRFHPTSAGNYVINIMWAGVHVPGSPFSIMISNPDELNES